MCHSRRKACPIWSPGHRGCPRWRGVRGKAWHNICMTSSDTVELQPSERPGGTSDMTTALYTIPGYPTVSHTPAGTPLTLRPMLPTDKEALLDFFQRIAPEDRLYLKDDVTSPAVIARWAETLDYRRVLPLLALVDNTIIGDGTLHHSRAAARKHIGE